MFGSFRFFGSGASMRSTLLLYVLAPLAAAMLLTGYFALRAWEGQVEQRMQLDLEMVARAIQLPLSHSMEREREGSINQALESELSIDSVYSAYAYDLQGDQIASAGTADPKPESREELVRIATDGERVGQYGEVAKRSVYSYFVPLKDSRNQVSGLLQLTRREEDFRDYIGRVRNYGFAWFALALLAMSVMVLIGQHQALGRHFARISESMRRVASGDTGHRLKLSGPSEIQAISSNFNRMLDSIRDAEEEIQMRREEQSSLEEQLRQSEKLAAVGQLAAGVAHELGTPLSTISGTAQRNLRDRDTDTAGAASFRGIMREVERMGIIIRQLLDFSHRQKLRCRKIDPARAVQSSIDSVAAEFGDAKSRIEVVSPRNGVRIDADPVRLEQAIVNLLRNALQSDPAARVRVEWKISDDCIVFGVDDSGPGISAELKARLFEPFFTTKSVGSGTGLGLAVVHGIVAEHGGQVMAMDSQMGGARFEMSFPIETNDGSKGNG